LIPACVAAAILLAPVVTGLDHVPIAVNDLDRAAADYGRLGFALKRGRPHDNGIRNLHAKFADGTELELITAPAARDALTTTYRRHLAAGDGPAFLALYVPSTETAPSVSLPPYVFFGPRNRSPTDRPEHFAHPNTSESLVSVWLAGADLARERRLLSAIGATFAARKVFVPDPVRATVARLPEGEILLLHASRRLPHGRPIVGATLRVRSLAAARRALAVSGVAARETPAAPRSVFVPPEAAHGLWLELREGR
jgi:catechol 2,3-dioxygenase-like lactoylglutathione lyase family enzyme